LPCSADFVLRGSEPSGQRVLDEPPTYLGRVHSMGNEVTFLYVLVMDTALGNKLWLRLSWAGSPVDCRDALNELRVSGGFVRRFLAYVLSRPWRAMDGERLRLLAALFV